MSTTSALRNFSDQNLETTPANAPSIAPEMGKVLTLAQKSNSSLTPKEVSAHLARLLANYDDLTTQYAENNQRIDAELASLKQTGGSVSGQLLELNAELKQQSGSLGALAATTDAEIRSTRDGLLTHVADSEERLEVKLSSLHERVDVDVTRLVTGVDTLNSLLGAQESIIREQSARLDQFDVTYEILDTATRGNRARIEVVRDEAEKKHALVQTQIQGLEAMQRDHYAELGEAKRFIAVLQTEAQRLEGAIQDVALNLSTHVGKTRLGFKLVAGSIAALLLVTLSGFALVKWSPALTPVPVEIALAQAGDRIDSVKTQLLGLPVLESKSVEQDSKIGQMSRSIASLERTVGGLKKSMTALRTDVLGTTDQTDVDARQKLVVQDSAWIVQQEPSTYTVQLIGVPTEQEMVSFVEQNAAQLKALPLAHTITTRDQRDRYNLFYGAFDSIDAANQAIASLPANVRANKPWVRSMRLVQATLR